MVAFAFSSNISRVVYGIESKEFSASSMIRYHDSDEVLIPPIKNGYYYFLIGIRKVKIPKMIQNFSIGVPIILLL